MINDQKNGDVAAFLALADTITEEEKKTSPLLNLASNLATQMRARDSLK